MKTIQKNELEAIQLAVQHVNPLLVPTLRTIIANGAFTPPPVGRGQSIYSIFTPTSPVPAEEGKAILDALEDFSKTPTGRDARFSQMTIYGVVNSWRNFIS